MNDLPERLRALAESPPDCEYVVPLLSAEMCLEAANAIEAMQRDHDAMEVLRDGKIDEVAVYDDTRGKWSAFNSHVNCDHGRVYADDPAEAILKATRKE